MSLPAGRVNLVVGNVLSRIETAQVGLELPARVRVVKRTGDATERSGWLLGFQGKTVELHVSGSTRPLVGTLWLMEGSPVVRVGVRFVPARLEDLRLPVATTDVPAPALNFELDVPGAWSGLATLSYPVTGLGWQSRHRLVTDRALTRGHWTAIATIQNATGWPVKADQLGLWSSESGSRPLFAMPMRAIGSELGSTPEPIGHRVRFNLEGTLDLGPGREEIRTLAEYPGITLAPRMEARTSATMRAPREAWPFRMRLSLTAPGPGPWASGNVQVVTPDAQGRPLGTTEAWIPETPPAQERSLDLGEDPDVTVQATLLENHTRSGIETWSWRYRIRNVSEREWPVTLACELPSGDWIRLQGSPGFIDVSGQLHEWRGSVAASGDILVTAIWQRTIPRGNVPRDPGVD